MSEKCETEHKAHLLRKGVFSALIYIDVDCAPHFEMETDSQILLNLREIENAKLKTRHVI